MLSVSKLNQKYIVLLFVAALILFASFNCFAAYSGYKDKRSPPAKYFDLSHWKLTLPNKSVTEITPKMLEAGYTSRYFYTGPGHTMVFWCKPGGTTLHTHYSRSELRERIDPTSDSKNWYTNVGTHILSARLRIGASTTAPKIVVLQVHAYHGDAPPLVKIIWGKHHGSLAAEYKVDQTGKMQKKVMLGFPGNHIFSCRIEVSHNILRVFYDGKLKLKHNISYWDKYSNYFKAGNYLQTTNPQQEGVVLFYSLSHRHDYKSND